MNSNKQPTANSQLPDSNNNAITSATVQPTHLKDPHVVLQNNPKLCTKGNIRRLAVKLARESFFGEEVMEKCTVHGHKNLPGLPK